MSWVHRKYRTKNMYCKTYSNKLRNTTYIDVRVTFKLNLYVHQKCLLVGIASAQPECLRFCARILNFFFFQIFFSVFFETRSPCNSRWPGTWSGWAQSHRVLPAFASWVMELMTWTTTGLAIFRYLRRCNLQRYKTHLNIYSERLKEPQENRSRKFYLCSSNLTGSSHWRDSIGKLWNLACNISLIQQRADLQSINALCWANCSIETVNSSKARLVYRTYWLCEKTFLRSRRIFSCVTVGVFCPKLIPPTPPPSMLGLLSFCPILCGFLLLCPTRKTHPQEQ